MASRYTSLKKILEIAKSENRPLSELVLEWEAEDTEDSKGNIYNKMAECLLVMEQASVDGCDKDLCSTSGLTGGDAYRLKAFLENGNSLLGKTFSEMLINAIAVSELNASMGRIVAAPTAGSCGILPAAIITLLNNGKATRHKAIMSLFTASAVGSVIANNASLAGAEGGCQAECGSASAMAAAAIVEIMGGTPEMIDSAVSIALGNMLGLVCDPVAGLVEIPCIMRNASSVANAFAAAECVLAGIKCHIPADETIVAMKRIGDALPHSLKETAEGGLAATPAAREIYKKIFG